MAIVSDTSRRSVSGPLRSCGIALAALVICVAVAMLAADRSAAQTAAVATAAAQTTATQAGATAAPANDDWPLFRGDAVSSGVARGTLPEKLDVLWKFTVPGGAFESTPTIVDGTVYIGDLDGNLFALDLESGEKRWTKKFENGFLAAPAVRDNRLYLGDIAGRFYCVDAKTGEPKWGFETQAEIDASANFYKDRVLVGSQDATLYCLDAAKGSLVWKFAIADQIRCSPTIVENRAFVAGCDSKLHVIDLDKGEEVSSVEIGAPTGVTPAVRGDLAYFGTEGGQFLAVNWKTSTVAWTFEPAKGSQSFRSSPAVTSECVVFGGRNKRVQALDPTTGKPLWEFATRNRVDCSPVIVGDRAYIGAADGRLYALRLKDGQKMWEHEAGGGFAGSAGVSRGKLVIANDNGIVFCFGAK